MSSSTLVCPNRFSRRAVTVRRQAMLDALEREFPCEAQWSKPKGGIFIWATLPDHVKTLDLLPRAVEQEKIAFVPGFAFGVQGGQSSLRLNFSNATPESIEEGVKRLGRMIREAVGQPLTAHTHN